MIKVSIIIPVYNVKKYLCECLDSVLAQTLKDIEIICVDDGSTDGSSNILDDYSKKDRRIKVIHKKNSGYGNTMNIGIKSSKGEYIGFVESDDCVLPNFYERLYKLAHENDLDLIKTEPVFWWSKLGYEYKVHYKNLDNYFGKIITEKDREVMYSFYMNTWSGIYKRSFLDLFSIRHNETPGASYQDNGFWFLTMSYCRRGMWISEFFYKYRQDNPEASVKNVNKVMAMSHEYEYLYDELIKRNVSSDIIDMCNYYRLVRNYGNFYRIADECKSMFLKKLINDYHTYGYTLCRDDYLRNKYERINFNSESICAEIIKRKKSISNKILECKKIYIYGAGNRGKRVYRSLCYMGYAEKVDGFVVSKEIDNRVLCNKNVYLLEENDYSEDTLIIISPSISSVYYKEMIASLEKKNILNYTSAEILLNDFYILA